MSDKNTIELNKRGYRRLVSLHRTLFVSVAIAGLLLSCGAVQAVGAEQVSFENRAGSAAAPDLKHSEGHRVVQTTETVENGSHNDEAADMNEHHDNATATAGHDSEHSATHEATGTPTNASAGPGDGGEHEGGDHVESDGNGSTGPVHLAIEGLQIVFGVTAVASVVLAARVYGGEIGRALLVSGAGVTLFATQRVWHNLHELGLLEPLPALGQQGLFILAAGALAAGNLSLYRTMTKRTG